MKKKYLLASLIVISNISVLAQTVTQSAEGTGTVILEGSAFSLNLGKTDLSFGWNNLNNSIVTKNNGFLIGTNVKVKNAEGLGNLFSKGDLVPQGNGALFIGGYLSNALKRKDNSADFLTKRNELLEIALKKFNDTFNLEVDRIAEEIFTNLATKATEIASIKAFFINNGLFSPSRLDPTDHDAEKQAFKTRIKNRFTEVKKNVEKEYRELTKERFVQLTRTDKTCITKYWKFTFFLFGGIDAVDFKRFVKIDSVNLENSFTDEYFRGGNIGIGVNYEIWRFRFGITYSYVASNNFSSLKSTDYTLQSSTVINNQTLQSKDAVTAYGGKYGKVQKNEFNADIIYNCKLDKKGESHLLINPYVRSTMFSRDTSLLINKINIGVGGYFFKDSGKFLGGIYIELPDVNNNTEKKKPVEKQNLLPPLRRLSFGVVTKFSLKAIFGW